MPRKTLILMPGLICNRRLWAAQIDGLRDLADIHVADFTTQTTIGEMAESVLAMAAGPLCIAGLSMGGYVGMETVRRAPDRIERLALLDTSPTPDTPERAQLRHDMLRQARTGRFRGVTERLVPGFIHQSRLADRPLVEEIMRMTEEVGRDAFLRQQQAILGRPDFRPYLPQVRCPTLVLCGREDERTPLAESERIAGAIPGATLVVVEACGHLSTMERPDEVNAALRAWLER